MMASYPDMPAIWAAIETQEGFLVKDASRNGYSGSRCGSVFWGLRYDGSFRECGGRAARAYAESGESGIQQIKCTRLDIAYSWRTDEYVRDIARDIFQHGPTSNKKAGNPRKRTFYENSDGGQTAYIGAPSSEVRMRIYDKYAEQRYDPQFANVWRCELQLRGETARRVWDTYHTAAHRPGFLVDLIAGQCEREDILHDYIIGGYPIDLPPREPNNKRVHERLQWLDKQVAPTVHELCKMGYGEEIERIFRLRDWT
jgi:DNA relaxase NicK